MLNNVIFKICTPFTNCIIKIKNIQVGDAHDIAVTMPMYNLIEYSDTYSKPSERLWQYYKDEPDLNNNNNVIDFPADNNNNNSISFKLNTKKQGKQETMAQKMLK